MLYLSVLSQVSYDCAFIMSILSCFDCVVSFCIFLCVLPLTGCGLFVGLRINRVSYRD